MQGLPEMLLPYLRLAHCTDSGSLKQASLDTCCSAPISAENELTVLHQLASHLQSCLSRCVSGLSAAATYSFHAYKHIGKCTMAMARLSHKYDVAVCLFHSGLLE